MILLCINPPSCGRFCAASERSLQRWTRPQPPHHFHRPAQRTRISSSSVPPSRPKIHSKACPSTFLLRSPPT
jgi:hypothetical protein